MAPDLPCATFARAAGSRAEWPGTRRPSSLEPPSPPPVPPDRRPDHDGFDFEPTDFEDARRVLDEESITQFDVAAPPDSPHWKRLRRTTVASDRALTGQGIDWLLALPEGLRPHALGRRFPRIVNGLAEIWDDPDIVQVALERLLNDGRKGRAGFPADVHAELVALRDWVQPF